MCVLGGGGGGRGEVTFFQDVLCQSEPFEINSTESESRIRVDRQI